MSLIDITVRVFLALLVIGAIIGFGAFVMILYMFPDFVFKRKDEP